MLINRTSFVKIKSISSSQWLDGRAESSSNVFVSDSSRDPSTFLQWELFHLHNDTYAVKSISIQCWLDGRSEWNTQLPWVSDGTRNPRADRFLQFQISNI